MTPELWVGFAAVFLSGGAIGTAGTLLAQWLVKKVDASGPAPRAPLAATRQTAQPTGRKAKVTTSFPASSVRNGTRTSSMSMPICSPATSVRRASTLTSSPSSTYPTAYGTKSSAVGPE